MSGLSLCSQAEQAGTHQPSAKQEEVKMLHPFIQLSALAVVWDDGALTGLLPFPPTTALFFPDTCQTLGACYTCFWVAAKQQSALPVP